MSSTRLRTTSPYFVSTSTTWRRWPPLSSCGITSVDAVLEKSGRTFEFSRQKTTFWSCCRTKEHYNASSRKVSLKGKAPYSWPPWNDKFRSGPFYIENLIYFFTKQLTLLRRSILLSLPSKLVFPAFKNPISKKSVLFINFWFYLYLMFGSFLYY